MFDCENCMYYRYDEYSGCYICGMDPDEDEMRRFMAGYYSGCPYYRSDDGYFLARKQ